MWLALLESNTTGSGRQFAAAARRRGLRPVLLTRDPARYPYVARDDIAHRVLDTADADAVLAAGAKLQADGGLAGITTSSEYFAAAAAHAAARLGLPGPNGAAVARCRDKGCQRADLRAAGVPVPDFRVVRTVGQARAAAVELGLPVVLKPVSGSGSAGVRRCATAGEVADWAAQLAGDGEFLVEQEVSGPEFSVETLDGAVVAVVAKHLGPVPWFVETGHDVPAPVPPAEHAALAEVTAHALAALGLGWGAAHTELRVTTTGPMLIEVNPRLAGGMIPAAIAAATGIDLVDAVVARAAGLPAAPPGPAAGHAAVRFRLPDHPGVLRALRLPASSPDLVTALALAEPGARVAAARSFRDRLACVVAQGASTTAAAEAAERAAARTEIDIDPEHEGQGTMKPNPTTEPSGATRVPRWTRPGDTASGLARYHLRLPPDLLATLTAARPLPHSLLAAHARVLTTVVAEPDLRVGYLPPGADTPVTRHLHVSSGSWSDLADTMSTVDETGGVAEILLDHSALHNPDVAPKPVPGVVLRIRVTADELTIEYDQAVLNQEYAARLGGYHLAALRALAQNPAAPHQTTGLLGDDEIETQLHSLAGPVRDQPATTFPALFAENARRHPDRLAASHGPDRRSYAELDAAANRIANALLAAGLRAEDPVAVVLDRGLDWLAAALGVFKAGGVYLPVRPDFPADRVATQLRRCDCRFVLTEPASTELATAATTAAGTNAIMLSVPDTLTGAGPDTDPEVSIGPDQAAYVYFTSGSTGTPKGALCEHAGLLNHLLMKIEDLNISGGAAELVTQTASQCFDISLWQFAAPLLAGGAVRIIDTDTQLGVTGFVDELAGGVTVTQVVPSYLEVLLTHLERHPRPLGRLHAVSVTGEALKLDLVRRWLTAYPEIPLVNAYGATEVSDDTMHEILTALPDRDVITVGDARRNVRVYVLDEHQRLAPLGSPGEIAFAGVSVGRGYINDPERTAQAFGADPYHPGERLYRTGDFGRWLPEGRIEFLGRRDEQVKIRGFRIEIGEIESRLLTAPGVREAAVVVDTSGGLSNLVAFVSGAEQDAAVLRGFLAGLLPEYMVPTYVHRLPRLPLTENGKVDKKALRTLAGTLGHAWADYVAPSTPAEQRLATVWAEVLGVPLERIGRDDDFFELGGTSLAAVRMLVGLGGALSLKQLAANPRLRALAGSLDERRGWTGLLAPLSTVADPRQVLVCFPYAGGNAVNFRSLAAALQADGVAVYGVEPPGHDLADDGEPMIGVPELAERVADELRAIDAPVLLWGHCAGAAAALATARLLDRLGRPARRVFLGALLLDTVADLRAEMAQVRAADNAALLTRMRADSAYVELDGLRPERVDVVGSAYRHDVLTANQHLLGVLADPASHRIGAPVEVVAAADDPTTPEHERRYADWRLVADDVSVRTLPDGGHYFTGTRPELVAGLVRAACAGRVPA